MQKRLRYRDLQERGIVRNRVTLGNWTRLQGFPLGQLTGPNTRTWSEDEVLAWLSSRPSAPKTASMSRLEGKRTGRRKAVAERIADSATITETAAAASAEAV